MCDTSEDGQTAHHGDDTAARARTNSRLTRGRVRRHSDTTSGLRRGTGCDVMYTLGVFASALRYCSYNGQWWELIGS